MDKSKYFLDLSKCTEEEQKRVFLILPPEPHRDAYNIFGSYKYLQFIPKSKFQEKEKWFVDKSAWNKTEITFSQFKEMMGSEGKAEAEKERNNSDGTLYIGEGLEGYYKDQLERTGKFKVISNDDYNKLQILLNHKPNPNYEENPFPGQLG